MSKSRLIGMVVGGVLLVGAVLAVAFFRLTPESAEEGPPPVRPLKTMVVGGAVDAAAGKYPGKVRASQVVDLAFQVEGPLVKLPVRAGQEVKQGDLIAQIDSRDYEYEWKAAQADLTEKTSIYEKIKEAFDNDAANQKELIEGEAEMVRAQSIVNIREKAFEDTTLKAPFAGRVAARYVENFQNVQAKEPIISLQDVSVVEIEINVPESRVVRMKTDTCARVPLIVSFDFLPGQQFPFEADSEADVEFFTEADPVTQTYRVRVKTPAPEGVQILPGMTATLEEVSAGEAEVSAFAVPVDAVPVDGVGQFFVWKVDDSADPWTVGRVNVEVGSMRGGDILVTQGLESGDRIATAGVTLLRDGQRVRDLESERSGG